MFKPNELLERHRKSFADLFANVFGAVCDAIPGITDNLNASNYDSAVRKVNPLDETHAIESILCLKGEQ